MLPSLSRGDPVPQIYVGNMYAKKRLITQWKNEIFQIEKIVNILPNITEHDIKAVGADFGSVLLNKKAAKEKYDFISFFNFG